MDEYQKVFITFSDGVTASYIGRVAAKEGDTRSIVGIKFSPPQKLRNGYSWESLSSAEDVEFSEINE